MLVRASKTSQGDKQSVINEHLALIQKEQDKIFAVYADKTYATKEERARVEREIVEKAEQNEAVTQKLLGVTDEFGTKMEELAKLDIALTELSRQVEEKQAIILACDQKQKELEDVEDFALRCRQAISRK